MEHEVCAAGDLADNEMRTVDLAGRKVLLARTAGRYDAVAATCPHAGGPLDEGALCDGVVICPWHKAAFDLATGACVEPPAVDDLVRFPVRVSDGRVLITLPEQPASPEACGNSVDGRCMAIIGAGAAGALAAQTLRKVGFSGRVVLIDREGRLPYDRTVLSKYALSGKKGGEKTPLQDEAFYAQQRIERLNREVVSLDPATRTIAFADGDTLVYDSALLATGGTPRPFRVPGHDLKGVHLLRTPADADAIVRSATQAVHAVVVGAGFIGLEVAASLRERGLEVAVVAPQSAPLERQLGAEVGNVFRRVHEREGVVFHLDQEVSALEGDHGTVERVRLKSGLVLPADLVVAGLGVVPATNMLHRAHRREDGRVEVDAQLRACDGLFAAGDIAAFPLHGEGPSIAVEHWRVAEQHGRIAALNMIGRGSRYDAVPVFWTISFLKRLDYVGHAAKWDEVVVEGDLEQPEFLAFYVDDGHVKALAGWGRDQQMARAIGLMQARRDWTVADLRQALT